MVVGEDTATLITVHAVSAHIPGRSYTKPKVLSLPIWTENKNSDPVLEVSHLGLSSSRDTWQSVTVMKCWSTYGVSQDCSAVYMCGVVIPCMVTLMGKVWAHMDSEFGM